MPAKSSAKGLTKEQAEASAATSGLKSPRRRSPAGAANPASGASVKTPIQSSGNGSATGTAQMKLPSKQRRIKVKKYSYKMPQSEHETIVALKEKLFGQGISVKKSELIRAGVNLLVGLSDARIRASLDKIPTVAARTQKQK